MVEPSTVSITKDYMTVEKKKLPPLSVRLDEDVRDGLERLAKADHRKLSPYINLALREHVERKLKKTDKR